MGLLDDAIREHLELKRLRGADPGAVAREEQAALGPIHREGDVGGGVEDEASRSAKGSFFVDSESSQTGYSPTMNQETVEINMEAELAAEKDLGDKKEATPQPEQETPVVHPAHTRATSDESLEWEMPSDDPRKSAGVEGSDAETDAHTEGDQEAAGQVEDVLEETPDFLRDTPEQERLWFEQRPPRDFDFNE